MSTTTTPSPYIKRLLSERAAHVAVIEQVQTAAHDEERAVTDDERAVLTKRAAAIKTIDDDLSVSAGIAQSQAKYASLIGAQAEADEQRQRDAFHQATGYETTGSRTPATDTRAAFAEQFGQIAREYAERPKGTSRFADLPSPGSVKFRAAITTATGSPTDFVSAVSPNTPAPLLDALSRVVVSSGKVDVLKMTQATGAAVVPEGELKPEANLVASVDNVALETWAYWKAVTRQALDDIPQMSSLLSDRLLAGLRRTLEGAAVDVVEADTDIVDVTGADWAAALRLGIATVQGNGYTPTAILMNPADAAAVDTAALAYPGAGMSPGSPWGLPIVASNSATAGTAYVGDWRQGVTWYDRGNTQAYVTDSHADLFIRNTFVVLAEARALFAVTDAAAVVGVTVTPPVAARSSKG